jgi:TolA-binding protein
VAFHELGKKDEAKAFYEEVVKDFPKSNAARKAQFRLKSLK